VIDSKIAQGQRHPHAGVFVDAVIGVQQAAPRHIARVGHNVSKDGAVRAAQGRRRRDRRFRAILQFESLDNFLVLG
jgi:hypothetical protein